MDGNPQATITINNGITAEQQDRFEDRVVARFDRIQRRLDQMSERTGTRFDGLDAKMADLRGSVTGLIGLVRGARDQAAASAAALTTQIEELIASGAGSDGIIAALKVERDALLENAAAVDAEVAEVLDSATATDAEVDAAAAEFGGDGEGTATTTTTPAPDDPSAPGGQALLSGATALADQQERNPE